MAKVIWLTGISGSGKTTLGLRLKEQLEKRRGNTAFIDGDAVRRFFEDDLGYTRGERIHNVKRIAFAAAQIAGNGTHVIVANIAPYYEVRDFIRKNIKGYIQIYLKLSLEEAMARDVKGHYAKYKKGEMKNIIGLDDPYDVPRNPNLTVDTEKKGVEECLDMMLDYLTTQGI